MEQQVDKEKSKWTDAINLTVIIAGLGYFVDMFDITLFGVIRVESLKAIGANSLEAGVQLYNLQMIGMMVGGVVWGILADKKGRLSVLFGSILLYSLGNIANAFVTNIEQYSLCRFITGFGLAGELGAAITIVAESLPKHLRGIGTTIVATLGLTGSAAAAIFGKHLSWQPAYILGGVMGLALLATRMKMKESFMFHAAGEKGVSRGNFFMLFKKARFSRYVRCIFIGAPIYFMTGVLFTFSPEITKALGVQGEFSPADVFFYGSIGLALGDLSSGLISQWFKSRKKSILFSLFAGLACTLIYLLRKTPTAGEIYFISFFVGLSGGYWAVLVTTAAEQFGTNLRGTVATTIPNFVRGSAVLVTLGFSYLKQFYNLEIAALIVGLVWFSMAIISLMTLEETFHKDLDFFEK